NGVRVKFFRRSFGGGDTAAIKVEDERDLETLFKLKTRYPELDKKTEFAVNGGNLSNNLGYEGSPMALKARCDDLTGDIDSWVADECDFTGNGVTVTLYRRTKSCISTAVAKKCDKAKVEKLLGLQLKKKRKANLNEEMIIRAAKEFYRIHGRFPHAGSKEPVPNLDETWSSISSACHCGGRGLIKGRTLSKILKPVRSSLGQGLTNKRLPRKFQAATEQAREFAARSSKKAVRSHLSLDKSRNVNYLKGDCFEQVVGLLLLSRFPKEKVIPQYCLVVDPKRAYYGMRADYAVTRRDGERDIYEVKWGNATDNIKETAEKHRGALGLKQSNYHMIFLEPNSKVREDYALFANLNQGLQTSPDLAKLIEQIKDQVEANNGEGLEAMRDYLYGLVIKANSFNGDDRIKFIQEELGGLYASDDAGNYMKEHSYALYASLEAYVEYEGKLCRELICPKALVKEEPDVYSLNYQLGDLCFENLCDLDLAVKIEMSGCDDSQSLNVDDLVPEDEKQFDKAIFTLPSGETISCHEDLSPDHLVRSPDEAKEVLDFNDGNFEFAESFIESYS
ncbi:MAG: hypothetical protein OXU45_01760, partial [Candidatus Melainabacteria bacterium]|nr:hypothetical protein [Candidatus Melainabacteria bacterium]